ncbi:NAD(P)/FAD-dependent oxidoreductase [Engelhardtia mirabilis]|uniref:NAD(P)/FAD-dependent oxidoreductase n=1 Tax=Engelhardtia mirabilis TaxID=2528011 RepID=UPI003AF34709
MILGGGSGGISVAARLARGRRGLDVCVIEPSDRHWYQPLWTLVGGGEASFDESERSEASLIPRGVEWLQDKVTAIVPERNMVRTSDGLEVTYDHLVVALGIQLDWEQIPGLAGNVGKYGICSNYSREHVEDTWRTIREFQGGKALFTHPSTPIKCGGAPQKIMYLADDEFRARLSPADYQVEFWCALPNSFAVEHYAKGLDKVMERRGCTPHYRQELIELRPEQRVAVFEHLDTGVRSEERYAMIHVTPMMSAPDVVSRSSLANATGWVDVDKHSLRHTRFPNVWSLGDCSSLPTSKTGAAIRKQAPVLAANLLAALDGRTLRASYDGYTSCPLVTGRGKLILAEFDYDKQPQETFPFDQSKERWSMYQLKRHILPQFYWHGMLKGRA